MAERTSKSTLPVRQGHYAGALPSLGLQHAWYETERGTAGRWQSLALMPIDEGTSAIDVAHGFARMAAEDPTRRVLMVNAQLSGCGPSERAVPPTLEEVWAAWANVAVASVPARATGPYEYIDLSTLRADEGKMLLSLAPQLVERLRAGAGGSAGPGGSRGPGAGTGADASQDLGRAGLIFAVDSVLEHTGAIPIARAVDKVVACVTLGRTRIRDIRRAAEIVGQERVLGVVAVLA